MKHFAWITAAALLLAACTTMTTTDFSGDLKLGEVVEGSLAVETPDTFHLEIGANTFLYGICDQISVDVVVSLLDSAGAILGNHDGPARGPEIFTYEVEKPGEYRLLVKPFEEESGDYTLKLEKVEPIATDAGGRADQLFLPYSGKETPGGVVGVIRDGKVVFSKAYGMADLTFEVPYMENTPSNIGSVSKQFTAFAILLLEQQGKLSLDDDVRKHIPELPDLGQVVTLKNMLNHTNGFREVYNLMPMTGWKGEDGLLKEEILHMLQRQKELQADPGEEYNYNNSAFILLAEIVERLSEQSFPEFMEEQVFGPMGMSSSVVRANPATIIPGASRGYVVDSLGFHEAGDLDASYGAGGIYTTVEDFARWMGNFADPQVGGAELIERLTTLDTLNNGDTMTYALGIGVNEVNGLEQWAHGGADIAHRAFLVYYPEIGGGAVALSNHSSFNSARIASEMAEIYFGEYMDLEEEGEGEAEGEETEGEEEAEDDGVVKVPDEVLEKYAGDYMIMGPGVVLTFSFKDDMLKLTTEGQPETAMMPLSQTRFSYEGVEAWIEFKMDDSGKVTGAVHTQGGADYEMERVPPYDPGPEVLATYTGRYLSDELQTFYTLELRDSTLLVLIRNTPEIELDALKVDLYKGDVFFLSEVKFTRDEAGAVTGFEASNGRTKGIRFDKLE